MNELEQLQKAVRAFRDARDWKQFHKPNQLAAAIAIEASELQEHFLWKTPAEIEKLLGNENKRREIGAETADILIFSLLLFDELGLEPAAEVIRKLSENEIKYPADRARGRATKYTDLDT